MSACSEEDEPVISAPRTILVYMAADNDLSGDGYKNIDLMIKGMGDYNGHLVVYFDPSGDVPKLLVIERGTNGKIEKRVVETYDEENSASIKTLTRVVNTTKQLFPSDSYGLILWSHGLAWIPSNNSFPQAYVRMGTREYPRTKYFGQDNNPGEEGGERYMDIKDLPRALPGKFSFILFDACFMASIEVLYELRGKSDYIIASPAEVLAAGFPYDKILPYLWGGEADMKQICRKFYDCYQDQSGDYQSATISLTKMAELESLAGITRGILGGKADEVAQSDVSGIRQYTLIAPGLPHVFYDFSEFVRSKANPQQRVAFDAQMNKTVIYKMATENYFGEPLPPEKYSGLCSYIPLQRWSTMNSYYSTLEWYRAVY